MLRSIIYLSFRGYSALALLNSTVQSNFMVFRRGSWICPVSPWVRITYFQHVDCKKTELKKTRLTRNLAIVSSLRSLRPSANVDLFMYRTKYLFRSTQMIHVRRLVQMTNLICQTQFFTTMFNGLKCLQVKVFFSNLYTRFGTWEIRRLKRSGPLDLNTWVPLNLEMSVELNWSKRRSLHVLNSRD